MCGPYCPQRMHKSTGLMLCTKSFSSLTGGQPRLYCVSKNGSCRHGDTGLNPDPWEVEEEGTGHQCHPRLCRVFEFSLATLDTESKKIKNNKKETCNGSPIISFRK